MEIELKAKGKTLSTNKHNNAPATGFEPPELVQEDPHELHRMRSDYVEGENDNAHVEETIINAVELTKSKAEMVAKHQNIVNNPEGNPPQPQGGSGGPRSEPCAVKSVLEPSTNGGTKTISIKTDRGSEYIPMNGGETPEGDSNPTPGIDATITAREHKTVKQTNQ
jgi:hypothetical protein